MSCQCFAAVTTTYENLKARGLSEDRAFAASVRVYRFYHPEQSRLGAHDVVAGWLDTLESDAEGLLAVH